MTTTAAADVSADTLYEVSDHIATITLNRPDKMNTLGGAMLELLSGYILAADRDPDVRVIILTANGRAFCAGLDLAGAVGRTGSNGAPSAVPVTIDAKTVPPTVLYNCDKPIICAMNGAAAGYGMDMALACDIRILGKSAKFAPTPVRRGIVPESGGTWILPRLIGWEKAAEVFFAARNLSADESKELGLCSHVVADDELQKAARDLATEIAANAPLAVQSAKRLMRMGLSQQFNDHCHHVFMNFLQLMKTDDTREGMTAFNEKRSPNFQGR
ncbi:MAG: enoyl-CoA hydratase [Pseudonocardiales bacterium]|nr:enoyl-CoA hydratase [Pseudonocardiales bacterium]